MFSTKNCEKGTYFVFREAKTIDDLGALLRLRYRVYRSSDLAKFIPENDYGLDVDCYDLRSRHFGLFMIKGFLERPVGYLRVVEDRLIPQERSILRLLNGIPDLRQRVEEVPPTPFPLMSYLPEKNLLARVYNSIAENDDRLVEAGRFALDESCRSLRLARHMVESALAIYFFYYNYEHAIWCCDASNAPFYGLYGMHVLAGSKPSDFIGIGEMSCCLFGSAFGVPDRARRRIEMMADAFRRTERIYCLPSNPCRFDNPEPDCNYGLLAALAAA